MCIAWDRLPDMKEKERGKKYIHLPSSREQMEPLNHHLTRFGTCRGKPIDFMLTWNVRRST